MNYLQLPVEILPHLSRMSGVMLAIWCDAYTWQQQGKQAYRTNAQLAGMLNVTDKSISTAVSNLKKNGLVEWSMVNGRQRILKAVVPDCPVERSPSRPTSTPSNFHPASRPTSTLPPVERSPCPPSNFYQDKKVTKEDSKSLSKEEVVLPFAGEEFKKMWEIWIQERKERKTKKYTLRGEQAALHKLQTDSNGDEQTAIAIIQQSNANSWTGLFPLKASKGGRNHNNGQPSITPEEFARVVTKKYW